MVVCESLTAVVILSYNSLEWHKLFLPKIVEQASSGYDVVLVDHASPDDTAEYVQTNFPSVKLIRLKENRGFAGGYADALAQVNAKYYILLSADFEVSDQWYPPLEQIMEAQPKLGAIQPKIRFWKDKKLFEYAGAAGGFMDNWGYMFCRGRIFDQLEEDTGQYNDNVRVFWASGGCLMVRAEAFHAAGGLDPDLFAHMEEIDLCWRLQNRGYWIGAIGNSTVYHVGGSIISYGSPAKAFFNYRNNLAIIVKNEQLSKLLWLVPLRLVLDGISGIRFATQGNWSNMWAIVRAHFSFYSSLSSWVSKRRKERAVVSRVDLHGVYPRSIVRKYFIQKKTKFSQLNISIKSLD